MSRVGAVHLSITSNARSLTVVRGAVERLAEVEGIRAEDTHDLILAIDEALTNVIKHGYGGQINQPIGITMEAQPHSDGKIGIVIQVRDQGRQVDPETICGRDLDDVRPGGLGVHIIRSVMDEVEYTCPADGGMLLRMVKYVRGVGSPPPVPDDPRR